MRLSAIGRPDGLDTPDPKNTRSLISFDSVASTAAPRPLPCYGLLDPWSVVGQFEGNGWSAPLVRSLSSGYRPRTAPGSARVPSADGGQRTVEFG
jgi:hypothetical protein